ARHRATPGGPRRELRQRPPWSTGRGCSLLGRSLGGGLLLLLVGAHLLQAVGVNHVRDRQVHTLGAIVTGSLTPPGRRQAALLAQQGQEDPGLLVTKAGQSLQSPQDLCAVGVADRPDRPGVPVI